MFMYCRLNQVFAKFDEVKMSGNMLATADLGKFLRLEISAGMAW